MKLILLTAFLSAFGFSVHAQNLALTFDNPQMTNDGSNDFYEVDIFVARTSPSDFKMGDGQFYLDYNALAFGGSIDDTTVDFEYVPGSILAEVNILAVYGSPIINSNAPSTVSIAWSQSLSAGSMTANNVTDIPALLGHLKIQMINTAEFPDVCFNVLGSQFDDQFYTACGPFTPGVALKDCANEPGTQLFDYMPDCSGGILFSCANSTEWMSGAWTNGIPDATYMARVSDNYDTALHGNLVACELIIGAGVTLNVRGGAFLDIENDITVDGTLIVAHQGSVVQRNGTAIAENNNTINVEITTPILQTRDFMVMGSPMSGETRIDVFNTAFLVLHHTPATFIPHPLVPAGGTNFADDNNDFWNIMVSGPINVGEGYIVRPQSGYTDPANTTFDFIYDTGTLNNGDVTRNVIFNGLATNPDGTPNAYANPYPSPVSAFDFINDNALVNEVYFWEHLTPPSTSIPGSNSINFSMGDISMYNLSGGTAAANDSGTSTEPNGIISTGQGFGIKAFGAGTTSFTNSMRRTTGNTTLRASEEDIDRMWLNVKNSEFELQSTTLIAFNPQATSGLDPGYDSNRLATFIGLYSHLDDGSEQLGIQTREAFEETIKIPVGFATQVEKQTLYTISISEIEGGRLNETTIYLIDNELNTVTNLNLESYSFASGKGTFNERFTLQFVYETLATADALFDTIVIYPNPVKDGIHITSVNIPIERVTVYDIQGRQIQTIGNINRNTHKIDMTSLASAVYFVKIFTAQGAILKQVIKE